MTTNYEWLTVDEAIKELEEGREVVVENCYSTVRSVYGSNIKNAHIGWFKALFNVYGEGTSGKDLKIRKPLTPEQLIKSGTPLLCGSTSICDYQFALVTKISIETDSNFRFDKLKFVINKDGNYITIKDGVIEEVLR